MLLLFPIFYIYYHLSFGSIYEILLKSNRKKYIKFVTQNFVYKWRIQYETKSQQQQQQHHQYHAHRKSIVVCSCFRWETHVRHSQKYKLNEAHNIVYFIKQKQNLFVNTLKQKNKNIKIYKQLLRTESYNNKYFHYNEAAD